MARFRINHFERFRRYGCTILETYRNVDNPTDEEIFAAACAEFPELRDGDDVEAHEDFNMALAITELYWGLEKLGEQRC